MVYSLGAVHKLTLCVCATFGTYVIDLRNRLNPGFLHLGHNSDMYVLGLNMQRRLGFELSYSSHFRSFGLLLI